MSDTEPATNDADISVEVDLPESEPEPVVIDEPDVTVVNTENSDGVDAALVSEAIETHDDIAELRLENERLQQQIIDLSISQVDTQIAAENAEATAAALAEQEAERLALENAAEHDAEPRNRTHPFWRKWGE